MLGALGFRSGSSRAAEPTLLLPVPKVYLGRGVRVVLGLPASGMGGSSATGGVWGIYHDSSGLKALDGGSVQISVQSEPQTGQPPSWVLFGS